MNKILSILFISVSFLNHGYSQVFSLSGNLTGFEDNTKIIINPFLDDMRIDMDDETVILLKDGKFTFTRQLEKPTKFSLRVRPLDLENLNAYENVFFWAENKPMSLEAKKGFIIESKISGSEIQDQYFEYVLNTSKLEIEAKQIVDSVKTYANLPGEKISEMRIRYHRINSEIASKKMDFLYSNPDNYCTAPELVFYVTFYPNKLDHDKLAMFYDNISEENKTNIYGTQIKAYFEKSKELGQLKKLEVGDYPYNFTLKDTTGNQVKLSSINNKLILLDFWAPGCGPCRKEHENYANIYKEFKDKGLEIVSVSQDGSKKRLHAAIQKDEMTWITLWDENKDVSNYLYKVAGLPTNYLIAGGKIVAISLRGNELREKIEELIAKK